MSLPVISRKIAHKTLLEVAPNRAAHVACYGLFPNSPLQNGMPSPRHLLTATLHYMKVDEPISAQNWRLNNRYPTKRYSGRDSQLRSRDRSFREWSHSAAGPDCL